MTTRAGRKWLIVHDPRGAFVARRDSPAAREAARDGATVSKFRTVEAA